MILPRERQDDLIDVIEIQCYFMALFPLLLFLARSFFAPRLEMNLLKIQAGRSFGEAQPQKQINTITEKSSDKVVRNHN